MSSRKVTPHAPRDEYEQINNWGEFYADVRGFDSISGKNGRYWEARIRAMVTPILDDPENHEDYRLILKNIPWSEGIRDICEKLLEADLAKRQKKTVSGVRTKLQQAVLSFKMKLPGRKRG